MAPADDKNALLQQLRIDRTTPERRGIPRAWWLGGAALLVVVAAVLAGVWLLRGGPAVEVQVASAEPPAQGGAGTAVLQATGYVTARREATVSTQITGTLTQVLIEEGDHVQQGQIVARLEDTAQRAGLAQAQAQLQAAQATLIQFQAQIAQAKRDLVRNQDLVGRHLVSQQALETSSTQVETLDAQLETQKRQVKLAEAGVEAARVQLSYTVVHAPFTGVIIAKAAQAGEIVSPISAGGGFTRTGVGTIVDMDSLEIEVDVNEAYIHRVQPGQKAQAVLDAYPDWTIPAHVIAIIPTADRSKATVKVRVGIDQKDPRVLPDMGVRVSFLEEAPRSGAAAPALKGLLIPASAVVQRAGKNVVFVVDGERVRERAVTPGETLGDLRLVEGLERGTRVVRTPPADLQDGARIVVHTS
ncbi:MAG TPA: efflux RND transporter periplasmic adaptor subunit [Steroidobacteraceae bacterium]|nr:efflux RND transporter periplasmic adaptor subunit [Steroidobacteraceae bacterium]